MKNINKNNNLKDEGDNWILYFFKFKILNFFKSPFSWIFYIGAIITVIVIIIFSCTGLGKTPYTIDLSEAALSNNNGNFSIVQNPMQTNIYNINKNGTNYSQVFSERYYSVLSPGEDPKSNYQLKILHSSFSIDYAGNFSSDQPILSGRLSFIYELDNDNSGNNKPKQFIFYTLSINSFNLFDNISGSADGDNAFYLFNTNSNIPSSDNDDNSINPLYFAKSYSSVGSTSTVGVSNISDYRVYSSTVSTDGTMSQFQSISPSDISQYPQLIDLNILYFDNINVFNISNETKKIVGNDNKTYISIEPMFKINPGVTNIDNQNLSYFGNNSTTTINNKHSDDLFDNILKDNGSHNFNNLSLTYFGKKLKYNAILNSDFHINLYLNRNGDYNG